MNTTRRITFRLDVVADDHDSSSLSDVVDMALDGLIDTISSEGWTVTNTFQPRIVEQKKTKNT